MTKIIPPWAGPGRWAELFPAAARISTPEPWAVGPVEPASTPEPDPLWTQLGRATDPRFEKPLARGSVRVEQLPGDKGTILCDDQSGAYVHLAPEDLFLWERMDGTRTQIDLVVDYCLRFKSLAPARIAGLVETLRAEGLLAERPDVVYPKLGDRLRRTSFAGVLQFISQTFLAREIAIGGIDGGLGALYRAVGWVLFTRPALLLFWLIAGSGVAAFVVVLIGQQFSIFGEGDVLQGAVLLGVFQVLALLLHELAHALAVKAYGRRVRRAGLFLLFGLPGVFVDTTDIWPAGKRAQLAVTWAGPFSNMVLGGMAALFVALNPNAGLAPAAYQFALSQYALVLLNLTPFLRLDGYYLLSDWLEIPNLNLRARGFIRMGLPGKLRQAWAAGQLLPTLTRDEKVLAGFGALSTLWITNLLWLGILMAPTRIVNTVQLFITGGFAKAGPLAIGFSVLGLLFALAMVLNSFKAARTWVANTGRTLRDSAPWRAALLFVGVAGLASAVPDLMMARGGRPAAAGASYVHVIALAAALIAIVFGARLSAALRRARLQLLLQGLTVTAALLLGLDLLALAEALEPGRWAWSAGLTPTMTAWARLLAYTPGAVTAVMTVPVWLRLLRASVGWAVTLGLASFAAAVLAVAVPSWGQGHLLPLTSQTLLAAALLLHDHFANRPLAPPRVAQDVDTHEAAQLLAKTVGAVAREMVQAYAEIAGKQALWALLIQFNTYAADMDWPLWLMSNARLGGKLVGGAEQRAPIYRGALAFLRDQIAARLGPAFALDAQAQALAELPLPMRAVFTHWIESAGDTGTAAVDNDRVRLRLAGRRLAETLVLGGARIYGWQLLDEAIGGFNRTAAQADWPMYIRGNGRLADELQGDLMSLAQTYTAALEDLLGRLALITGEAFVKRGVRQVYDGLPWEAREVATSLLFAKLSWAKGMTQVAADDTRLDFLRSVPLLAWLPPNDLAELAQALTTRRVTAGQVVAGRGDYARHTFLVRQGSVQAVAMQGQVQRTVEEVRAGGLIGLHSLLEHKPLPYAYVAQTSGELWLLPAGEAVRRLAPLLHVADALDDERGLMGLLAGIPLLAGLNPDQRTQLAHRLEAQHLERGATVLEEGAGSQGFFIVKSGELEVLVRGADDTQRQVSVLGPGEFFGEAALLNRTPVTATVRARGPVELLRLPPAGFYELLATEQAQALALVHSRRAKERGRLAQAAVA